MMRLLVAALLILSAAAAAAAATVSSAAAGARNESCVFQLRYEASNIDESDSWPNPPLSLKALYDALLPADAFPTLNASREYMQFDDVIWNISRCANRSKGPTKPGAGGDVDPYAGCAAMLAALSAGSDPTIQTQYGIMRAWIGFQPAWVPRYMRKEQQQPVDLYMALGSIGAFLLAVQIGYGVYFYYQNRDLEKISESS